MATSRSTIERQKSGHAHCTVTLSPEEAQSAEKAALQRLGDRVKVKGFRPGKVPEEMVREQIDPNALFEETVRMALRTVLPELIKEHELRPIVPPKVEAVSKEPLVLKITFIERPQIQIKHPEKLAPKKEPLKVDEKDIEKVIQSALSEHRTFAAVERAAAKGDRVTANFSAKDASGKDIPGLSAQGEKIVLGESRLLPGFEDALVGVTAGATKEFMLTLPEKFPAEELKGKTATFTVTVQSVDAVKTPTFDDTFAKEKLDQPSVAAFRMMVETTIKSQEEQFQRMSRERKLLDAIRDAVTVDLPDELIQEELRSLVEDWATRLEQHGKSIEDVLKEQKKDAKQIEEELRDEAKKRWKLRLGIAHLIDEKKIELSEGEEKAAFESFLANLRDEDRTEAQNRINAKDALYDEVRWRAMVDKLLSALLAD